MSAVHPRTRGEHQAMVAPVERADGSSPHTRGTPRSDIPGRWASRFIPAHAGNTLASFNWTTASAVHPRTRGEHPPASQPASGGGGSSPHTRGTRHRDVEQLQIARFIPAHAGNTAAPPWWYRSEPVHPRTRGEHNGVIELPTLHTGSSPHTRGTQIIKPLGGQFRRFIPAHAGNTL